MSVKDIANIDLPLILPGQEARGIRRGYKAPRTRSSPIGPPTGKGKSLSNLNNFFKCRATWTTQTLESKEHPHLTDSTRRGKKTRREPRRRLPRRLRPRRSQ